MTHKKESTKLEPMHEIVGRLAGIEDNNDWIRLKFTICKEIEVPYDAIPKEKLQAAVGHQVGIFNSGDRYKLRRIKK